MPLLPCRSRTVEKLLIHWLALALALAVGVLARGAEKHVAAGQRVAR